MNILEASSVHELGQNAMVRQPTWCDPDRHAPSHFVQLSDAALEDEDWTRLQCPQTAVSGSAAGHLGVARPYPPPAFTPSDSQVEQEAVAPIHPETGATQEGRPQPTMANRISLGGVGWLFTALLLSGFCLFKGISSHSVVTKPIEQVALGDQVVTDAVRGENDVAFGESVDPEAWRRIELLAPKRDGTWADVELLRPVAWLEAQGAAVGGAIEISVPECGIEGNGQILRIGPCPEVRQLGGRTVTGVYRHQSADVMDLRIEGLETPIGVTGSHPLWPEDRQEFVRADALRIGERLLDREGQPRRLLAATVRTAPEPVFNLEVQVDHVYHVSQAGILVHNGTQDDCLGVDDLLDPVDIGPHAPGDVPDEFIVVRGGTNPMPPHGEVFSGAQGATLPEAATGVPHGQIRAATAGEIRHAGGSVTVMPEPMRSGQMNSIHVDIVEGSSSAFGELQPNPMPKIPKGETWIPWLENRPR